MQINLERMKKNFNEMSLVGATPRGGVTRLTLSDNDKEARDLFTKWLKNAGLSVRVDDIGNIYGRKEGTDSSAKPIVLGSHLDTVIDSGKYDGVTGIISALEVIETLHDNSITTKRPIEIVNITNEEGFRFDPLMGGSGVLSGDYNINEIYSARDTNGKSVLDELKAIGYLGNKKNRLQEVEAFIELHIEQGPILEDEGIPLGVVESIMGLERLEVTVFGEENNAGPTPMHKRKDALCTAAKMVLEIQNAAKLIGKNAITTVGYIHVEPGIVNMIPGKVKFLVDVRDEGLNKSILKKYIINPLKETAKIDGVDVEIKETISIEPTFFSNEIIEYISQTANRLGYPLKQMHSGSGHISTFMNKLGPSAMIFVPSVDGKSHVPEEKTHWADIKRGTHVLLNLVNKIANK